MANTKVKAEQLEAAQTSITSVGTLTALQVDNLNLNGNTVSSTDTNGNITIAPNGTGDIYANTDKMIVLAAEGESATLMIVSDESDDNGDDWSFVANQSNNTLTIENDISGSSVSHLTITPHATVASSTVYVPGMVGIGTNSPDVNSFGAGHGILTVQSGTGSAKTAMLNLSGDGNDTDASRVSSLFFNDASATGAGKTLAGVEAYRASNHATDPGGDLLFSTNVSGGSYTERMRIQADGKVGIGTTAPVASLHVFNNESGGTSTLRLRNSHTDKITRIQLEDSQGSVGDALIAYVHSDASTSNHYLGLGVNNQTALSITNNDYVGIGTTSPTAKLHIEVADNTEFLKATITGNEAWAFKGASGSGATDYVSFGISGGTQAMAWQEDGKVGIGTTAPWRTAAIYASSQAELGFKTGSVSSGALIYYNDSEDKFLIRAQESGDHIAFQIDGATERMRIDSSGRLLIGTTASRTMSGVVPQVFLEGTDWNTSSLGIVCNHASTNHSTLLFGRSKGSTDGSNGLLASGDCLAKIRAHGDDGSNFEQSASIEFYVDATPSANEIPGRISFWTSADAGQYVTERMRIRESGSVHIGQGGIGLDSNYANFIVKDNNVNRTADCTAYFDSGGTADWTMRVGGSYDYALRADTTSSAGYAIGAVADSSTWVFRVNGGGTIYAVSTSISSISDRRLKENITDAKSQWDDIKALKWKNFNWTKESGHDTSKPLLGLIADEVEKVSPNLIEIDAQPKEDIDAGKEDPEYKTVKYSIVWMKAMKALQEAMERIETLESEVKTLKGG